MSGVRVGEVATGGTLFANALSMAAGHAALEQVLTEDAFERTGQLGTRVADGLRARFDDAGVPWSLARMSAHCYYAFSRLPSEERDRVACQRRSRPASADPRLHGEPGRVGIGLVVGATVSVAHTASDVDRYLEVFADFLSEASRG